jgi:hypothetical protein
MILRKKKLKKILLFKSDIIKLFNKNNKTLNIKEIYLVNISGKLKKNWRQHMNATKNLICIIGAYKLFYIDKDKVKIIQIKKNESIVIPKKTIFKFTGNSDSETKILVFSDKENAKLKTNKIFKFS